MDWKEEKCDENRLKVQLSEVKWSKVKWCEMKCSDVRWNGAVGNLNGFKPNERVVKCNEVLLGEV